MAPYLALKLILERGQALKLVPLDHFTLGNDARTLLDHPVVGIDFIKGLLYRHVGQNGVVGNVILNYGIDDPAKDTTHLSHVLGGLIDQPIELFAFDQSRIYRFTNLVVGLQIDPLLGQIVIAACVQDPGFIDLIHQVQAPLLCPVLGRIPKAILITQVQ